MESLIIFPRVNQKWMALIFVGVVLPFSPARADLQPLEIFNLSGNFESSNAFGITESGVVLGGGSSAGASIHTQFTYQNGVFTVIPDGSVMGINDNGLIVGNVGQVASSFSGGTWTPLGSLGGSGSQAYRVDNSGIAVGTANVIGDGSSHAVSYSGGVATDLGTLGGLNSYATAISETGLIVGSSQTLFVEGVHGEPAHHAFIYQDNVMTDLGAKEIDGTSYAHDVNDAGDVVGYASVGGTPTAVLWRDGIMEDLAVSPDFTYSIAFGINNNGLAVGYATEISSGQQVAVLYDGNQVINLNDLVALDPLGPLFTLRVAAGINDAGDIYGSASDQNGNTTGFVLKQVPEPSTYALLGLGLFSLFLIGRRKFWRVSP